LRNELKFYLKNSGEEKKESSSDEEDSDEEKVKVSDFCNFLDMF